MLTCFWSRARLSCGWRLCLFHPSVMQGHLQVSASPWNHRNVNLSLEPQEAVAPSQDIPDIVVWCAVMSPPHLCPHSRAPEALNLPFLFPRPLLGLSFELSLGAKPGKASLPNLLCAVDHL